MKKLDKFAKKFRTHGLISSLAVISIIGFGINAWNVYTGNPLPVLFAYPSIVLGLGLILESQIIGAFGKINYFIKTENEIAKFLTFVMGSFVLLGGLASSPVFGLVLPATIVGAIGMSNIIAMLVIMYELFFID